MPERDFFIAYTSADRDSAEWIARQLEAVGYTILIQAWDIRSAINVRREMQKASEKSIRTLIVLSQSFLDLKLTEAELTSVFGRDPVGQFGKLVPVRIGECNPIEMLGQRTYIDLVGLSEEAARSALLDAVKAAAEPAGEPIYVVLEKETAMDLFLALAQALGAPFDKNKEKGKGNGKRKYKGGKGKPKGKGPKGPGRRGPKGLKAYEREEEYSADNLLTRAASPEAEPVAGLPETGGAASLQAAVPASTRGSCTPESSATGAEPVDTAVFCPPQVPCDSVFMVQVFLYPPRAATEVDTQARRMDEAAERRGTYSLPLELRLGTRVDLHLEIPSLIVLEPDAVLVWRGSMTAAQFEVAVPADAAVAQVIGRVRIAVDRVPSGILHFKVVLTAAGTSLGAAEAREARARRYRRAFVSYSSLDRAEVLRRVQAFRIAGLSVFQDILDLDPGERWQMALYHEIDRCDVFLLFWSHAAAASEWVGKEIEYALARKQGDEERPPDIQPVPIEGPPIVPPPASLKGLHFNDGLLAQIRAADTTALPQRATDDARV